jgi:hypothetical protein
MFVVQTIHNVCSWYTIWLGFIKYDGRSDQAINALLGVEDTPANIAITGLQDLLTTLRIGIADSIMVGFSIALSSLIGRLKLWSGLALLGYLQSKLESSHRPPYFRCRKHRYASI